MASENGYSFELDGDIPVLRGENGKTMRMGLQGGLPQFYLTTPSGSGEWFMRIHPDKFPNGMQSGSYEGKSTDGSPRMLTIREEANGRTQLTEHPPGKPGRFIIVTSSQLVEAWECTLEQFNSRQ